jgi:beta,beta-carotene 9',10'-dioxygenase
VTMAPYASAGFGASPELTLVDVPVRGELPVWLRGTLLRNGPGTFNVGQQRYRHWFDGLAMLHRFTINEGRVSYANKFLRNRSYDQAMSTGRIAYAEFATDPCRSLFARAMAVFHPSVTDSAKVNIVELAGHFVALAETPIQVEFDPHTLDTVGVMSWDRSVFGRMTTVHPHLDRERQEAINLVTRFGAISNYALRRMDLSTDAGPTTELASVRVGEPAYIHSFGMSQRYLIIVEFPLVVNPVALLLWLRPYIENFRWKPERGTRFHVVDRVTGRRVRTFTTEPFFAFHHVNAYDNDDELVVDLVAYDDHRIIESFYLHRLEDPDVAIPHGTLRRFRLPLNRKDVPVRCETLSETAIEMPTFDYARYNTSPEHRYVYGIGLKSARGFYDQIVKIDTVNRSTSTWREPHCYPGEPVFVAQPQRREEDDGVLLSIVLDAERGTSFLLVLDAATLHEIARAELPHAVLFGYHGIFVG